MSEGPPSNGWTVTLTPDDGGESRTFAVSRAQLTRWRIYAALGALCVLAMAVALGIAAPRALTVEDLHHENIELRERLQDIDQRMSEIDQVLLRLRLYDAQLQSVGGARGNAGPFPPGTASNDELPVEDTDVDDLPAESLEAWEEGTSGLHPAEAWADAVVARTETVLGLVKDAEPNLNELVQELEGLRALREALPGRWPAQGTLTSGYGWRRHPLATSWRFHSGLDISNRRGVPIFATAPGKVITAGWSGGYGRTVEIDHGYGITTLYAHCNRLRVKEGDMVEQGDFIATLGSTGQVTGPHLHFELHLDGHPVNPLDYLPR